jgi:AbrB family looped-hinge helix DNA binding protein
MSSVVTVTGSGQITIPAELRRKHGIATGDRVIVSEGENGQIVVRPGPRSIQDLKGIFPLKPGVETTGDFDDLIQEAFEEGYAQDWKRQSDE